MKTAHAPIEKGGMQDLPLHVYRGWVMHARMKTASQPHQHRFRYPLFMFSLNLDKVDEVEPKIWGYNRLGLFRFNDKDFLPQADNNVDEKKKLPLKQKVLKHLADHSPKLATKIQKIVLLSHHRMWGYLFNPASFYFCYDCNEKPVVSLVEVTNTFKERKIYIVPAVNKKRAVAFSADHCKHFYISPFSPLRTQLHFRFRLPGETMHLHVNQSHFLTTGNEEAKREKKIEKTDKQKQSLVKKSSLQTQTNQLLEEKPYLYALFHGKRKAISNSWQLLFIAICYPVITFKVFFLIHFEALRLWLKRIPYFTKKKNLFDQRGVFYPGFSEKK